LIYSAENNAFLPRNEINRPILGEEIKDFNNYKNRTKIWCYEVHKAQNKPVGINGVLEVIDLPTKDYIKQVYYGDDKNIYYRVCNENIWRPWRKMVTEDEHKLFLYKLDEIVKVVDYGTDNGNFKFLPRKGRPYPIDLADVDFYKPFCKGKGIYKGGENFYFSLLLYGGVHPISSCKNGPDFSLGGMWMFIAMPYTDIPSTYIVYNTSSGPTFIWRPKGASIWTHSPYQLWQDWRPI